MKANFALSLSFEGIQLLFRAADGWRFVDQVQLDSDSLGADLATLREKAQSLAPDGVFTKLIIPNDQVKYLSLNTGDLSRAERLTYVQAALEDATPYSLDELVFSFESDGPNTHVAATARMTLEEAENFAVDNDFHPISYIALPDAQHGFVNEAFFGATDYAIMLHHQPTADTAKTVSIGSIQDAPPLVSQTAAPLEPQSTDVEDTIDSAEQISATPAMEPEDTQLSLPIPGIEPSDPTAQPQSTPTTLPEPSGNVKVQNEVLASSQVSLDNPKIDNVFVSPDDANTQKPKPQNAIAAGSVIQKPRLTADAGTKLPSPNDEAERMTIFGARSNQRLPSTTTQNIISIAIAAFTVLILGAAGWFTFVANGGIARFFNGTPDVVITKQESPEGISPQYLEHLSPEDAAILDALRHSKPEDTPNIPSLTEQELAEKYAVTGIWPKAPDGPTQLPQINEPDLYIASIDPGSDSQDAIALPNINSLLTDYPLEQQNRPAALGTVFALDENGFVIPTIQGAMSPDGVLVYLGRPVAVPPNTPNRSEFTAAETAIIAELSKVRPIMRPNAVQNVDEPSEEEKFALRQMASTRPQLRPKGLKPAEKQPEETQEPNDTAVVEVPKEETKGSPQAVASSVRPDARPKNFAKIVNRAQNKQKQKPQRVAAASEVIRPTATTTASVAKSATMKNALKLGRVNLIGVYGKPSNRRALIRLSNGSFKKVKVGDRIDGGRISAISDTELRYKKGGRNLTLKMPKG